MESIDVKYIKKVFVEDLYDLSESFQGYLKNRESLFRIEDVQRNS